MTMDMNASDSQANYMLLFRHTRWDGDLSTEETREVMDRVTAWFEDLAKQGKAVGGQPLLEQGKTVTGQGGKVVVTDGPFAESKEAVGGYLLLQVDGMEEAVRIASASPLLQFGVVTEVRELAEQCPILERIKRELAAA